MIISEVETAIEKTDEEGVLQVETLGVNGQELAPLIDWEKLPSHIPRERILDFAEYYLNKLGGKATELLKLITNIRYIDQENTELAFQKLAEHLKKSYDKKIVLVHDGEEDGSRKWVCETLAKIGNFEVSSIENLAQTDKVQFVVADDLMLFGEQSAHLIEKIVKINEKVKVVEAYLAGTGFFQNGFRANANKHILKITQVYKIPTLSEAGSKQQPLWNNLAYVLTFFSHKVPDRFLPLLSRSNSRFEEDGKHHWLLDDMCVAPPYDSERFLENGKWGQVAKRIPRALNL